MLTGRSGEPAGRLACPPLHQVICSGGGRARIAAPWFVVVLVALALLTGCGDDGQPVTSGGIDDEDPGGAAPGALAAPEFVGPWVLTAGIGPDQDGEEVTFYPPSGDDVAGAPPVMVTLVIEENGQLGGRAACNGYGGRLAVGDGDPPSGGALLARALDVSKTEMGCDPLLMSVERAFLDALLTVDTLDLVDGALRWTGDGAALEFVAEAPPPTAELVDQWWELTTLVDGITASSTVASAEPARLRLAADGTFEGSTGCRSFSGEWIETGAEIVFPSWGLTGDCAPDVADQDARIVEVLESFRATVDGQQLTLAPVNDPDGRALIWKAVEPGG